MQNQTDNHTHPEVQTLQQEARALVLRAEEVGGQEGDDLRQQAEVLLNKAKAIAQEWSAIASDKGKILTQQATEYTKENPLKAVGIAAAAGIFLGMLFKGKKKQR